MKATISSFVASSLSILVFCSVNAVAFADGMPFEEPKPKQILTPIDKSLSTGAQNVAPAAAPAAPPAQLVTPAEAAAPPPPPPLAPPAPESRVVNVQPNSSFFGLSVGMYDAMSARAKATSFNVEWQPGVKIAGYLQPLFGAMATTRGSLLGYGGIGAPINITDHVFLMPSIAIGGYKHGNGYDLRRTVVERVGAELAYQFDDKSRLGVNFSTLTDGMSFHKNDRVRILALTYTMPFNGFSGTDSHTDTVAAPVVTPVSTLAPAETKATPAPHAP